ncbi:MAG: hypothetical protein QM831_37580 [Kofleriaceae bacterium]
MRWAVALCLLVGCGKQLNPDYCMAHEGDPDCASQGLVFIDAAGPCQSDPDCTDPGKTVCDLSIHSCVQCAGTDRAACVAPTSVCTASDTCVECVTNADCASGTSGVCLTSSNTCAPTTSILYVTTTGISTGTCPDVAPCALDYAINTAATADRHVISIAAGDYNVTTTLNLAIDGIHLVPTTQGMVPKIANTSGGKVFNVSKPAQIDSMDIAGSTDSIIACSGTSLVITGSNIHNTSKNAISSNNCALTVQRSKVSNATQSAFGVQDGHISLVNNFIFANGSTGYTTAAISLDGNVQGEASFNTIAYNTSSSNCQYFENGHFVTKACPAGIDCANQSGGVTLNGNLFVANTSNAYVYSLFTFKACTDDFTVANMQASEADAAFVSTSDLHLTSGTKSGNGKVRDVGNINCNGYSPDIDGDARPQNAACDYGADEYATP